MMSEASSSLCREFAVELTEDDGVVTLRLPDGTYLRHACPEQALAAVGSSSPAGR